MLRELIARIKQGHQTMAYPEGELQLPDRLRWRPILDAAACAADCHRCEALCPTQAILHAQDHLTLDMGRCLFCGECTQACPTQAIRFSTAHQLAVWASQDLILGQAQPAQTRRPNTAQLRLLRRSLKIRVVSAVGCKACEADVNVLSTIGWDLGRFGIQIVASPRHADALLVVGPVMQNMALALKKTYLAIPPPRLVIAVGACACSGGPYQGHSECQDGLGELFPVDLWIPGCPPHPSTILDGLLKIIRDTGGAQKSS